MEFKIALHTGDDNDNSIRRFTMESDTKENLLQVLSDAFSEEFEENGGDTDDLMIDGDENSLTIMWFENDIPYHHDYYIESTMAICICCGKFYLSDDHDYFKCDDCIATAKK